MKPNLQTKSIAELKVEYTLLLMISLMKFSNVLSAQSAIPTSVYCRNGSAKKYRNKIGN